MQATRLVLLLFLTLSTNPNLKSQQSTAPSPQRDSRALMVLAQMAAAGWGSSPLPIAITASGTMTHFDGDQQQTESLTLTQRGPFLHRIEIVNNGATTTQIVNGLSGIILFSDGTKHRLPPHAALSNGSPVFPFFTDLINSSDLSVDVLDLGTDTIDGIPCHGVSIARQVANDDKLAKFRNLASPLKVWNSVQSGLPVRIEFIRLADDNPYLPMHFSRSFSDYRSIGGVAVAFIQEERFEGQLIYRLQFTSVQFNPPLTDADFDTSKL
jgi:hypothetical protein